MSRNAFRPQTLFEVSSRAATGTQTFDPALREFLDDFYSNPGSRPEAIAEEALLLDDVKDAYLAAVAEHLAMRYRLDVPAWAEGARTTAEASVFRRRTRVAESNPDRRKSCGVPQTAALRQHECAGPSLAS